MVGFIWLLQMNPGFFLENKKALQRVAELFRDFEHRKSSVTLTPSGLSFESPEFLSWLRRAF
ncbi:hypothetical protein LEP1GSC086_0495 [Leptospira weilii str. LNT 1234]|nr:hypothetical protein LEP1GSC086_0495 [Leptospira weilii str. LNT 1234]QDK22641.1 hypothetical protein FHG67_07955 [Leptospira weilii]QDK27714.1 hypothetical protein FHG68_14280 [Leptospira weilii]